MSTAVLALFPAYFLMIGSIALAVHHEIGTPKIRMSLALLMTAILLGLVSLKANAQPLIHLANDAGQWLQPIWSLAFFVVAPIKGTFPQHMASLSIAVIAWVGVMAILLWDATSQPGTPKLKPLFLIGSVFAAGLYYFALFLIAG